jgi:thiol:disulfide interchange protein DsbC
VIRQSLAKIVSNTGGEIDSIEETPVPGVYQVMVGSQILYVSADGQYVFNGDLYESQTSVNLTEPVRAKSRAILVQNEVDQGGAIIYKANGETKYRLNVFTDIDCGYCRELHKHIDEFAELGIEVRYLMMPRSAVGSPSYIKAVNAVCAKNPQKALTELKMGNTVEDIRCDENRVANTMQLAQRVGIRGTPGAVSESGELIPGYRQPQEFLTILENLSKK